LAAIAGIVVLHLVLPRLAWLPALRVGSELVRERERIGVEGGSCRAAQESAMWLC
jgi:hypothetical protein